MSNCDNCKACDNEEDSQTVEVTIIVPQSKHSALMSLLMDQMPVEIKSDTMVIVN